MRPQPLGGAGGHSHPPRVSCWRRRAAASVRLDRAPRLRPRHAAGTSRDGPRQSGGEMERARGQSKRAPTESAPGPSQRRCAGGPPGGRGGTIRRRARAMRCATARRRKLRGGWACGEAARGREAAEQERKAQPGTSEGVRVALPGPGPGTGWQLPAAKAAAHPPPRGPPGAHVRARAGPRARSPPARFFPVGRFDRADRGRQGHRQTMMPTRRDIPSGGHVHTRTVVHAAANVFVLQSTRSRRARRHTPHPRSAAGRSVGQCCAMDVDAHSRAPSTEGRRRCDDTRREWPRCWGLDLG